jgi:hypothetical protein
MSVTETKSGALPQGLQLDVGRGTTDVLYTPLRGR